MTLRASAVLAVYGCCRCYGNTGDETTYHTTSRPPRWAEQGVAVTNMVASTTIRYCNTADAAEPTWRGWNLLFFPFGCFGTPFMGNGSPMEAPLEAQEITNR